MITPINKRELYNDLLDITIQLQYRIRYPREELIPENATATQVMMLTHENSAIAKYRNDPIFNQIVQLIMARTLQVIDKHATHVER
jgi:hypothetical protein